MTCAACSSGIERTVSKLKGVEACSVSLMGESMEVSFDESVVSDARIKSAVSALGYGAYDFGAVPEKKKKKFTLGVRFVLSLILLIPEMYLSMGHMMGIPVPHGWLNYGFQVGLTLLILLINGQFFVSGVRAAVRLVPNMDTLVTLGAAVSFVYSLVMAILTPEEPTLFFESAAMIVTLVTLGKWLEDKSKRRTGREIEKLRRLAPDTVTVEREGKEEKIALADVAAGDTLVVRQGENAVSSTLTYSVHDYIANTADSQVAGSADLVKAMYGLGKAASAYANLGNFGYTADTDNNTLAETYENEAYSWVYPVALQGVSVADGTVTLDNVVTDKALTVIGANGTLALVGENSVRSLQTGAKLTVDGEGSLTLTADGAETAINATGELQIENGTLTADAGVNIDTLRMKGGAVDLTNIAATYNIRNFELADGTFTAKDTLRTDKLVVKGGTLDIDVATESGDDPSGITPYSDAEGQRYYFLGGNVTLSRTGNSGSGGLFSWGTGGGVAVVVAGQTRIDVDGFDWAVVFGEVGGTFYEFTQNNPEYGLFNTTPNRVSLAGDSSVNDRIWGTEYWTQTVGATVTTTSTANNESELCGHPLEFTHDVDFDNL